MQDGHNREWGVGFPESGKEKQGGMKECKVSVLHVSSRDLLYGSSCS